MRIRFFDAPFTAGSAIALLLAALSTSPSAVNAQCRQPIVNYRSYATPVVKKKVIHEDIVFTRYLAVIPLLDLPTYSAHVVPALPRAAVAPAAPLRTEGPSKEMGQVLQILQSFDGRFRALEDRITRLEGLRSGGTPLSPPPPRMPRAEARVDPTSPTPGGVTAKSVNQQMCAICHDKGNESNGGDFVLSVKGEIVRMTDAQLVTLGKKLATKSMPKLEVDDEELQKKIVAKGIRALNPAEANAWADEIDRQAGLNAAEGKK